MGFGWLDGKPLAWMRSAVQAGNRRHRASKRSPDLNCGDAVRRQAERRTTARLPAVGHWRMVGQPAKRGKAHATPASGDGSAQRTIQADP